MKPACVCVCEKERESERVHTFVIEKSFFVAHHQFAEASRWCLLLQQARKSLVLGSESNLLFIIFFALLPLLLWTSLEPRWEGLIKPMILMQMCKQKRQNPPCSVITAWRQISHANGVVLQCKLHTCRSAVGLSIAFLRTDRKHLKDLIAFFKTVCWPSRCCPLLSICCLLLLDCGMDTLNGTYIRFPFYAFSYIYFLDLFFPFLFFCQVNNIVTLFNLISCYVFHQFLSHVVGDFILCEFLLGQSLICNIVRKILENCESSEIFQFWCLFFLLSFFSTLQLVLYIFHFFMLFLFNCIFAFIHFILFYILFPVSFYHIYDFFACPLCPFFSFIFFFRVVLSISFLFVFTFLVT